MIRALVQVGGGRLLYSQVVPNPPSPSYISLRHTFYRVLTRCHISAKNLMTLVLQNESPHARSSVTGCNVVIVVRGNNGTVAVIELRCSNRWSISSVSCHFLLKSMFALNTVRRCVQRRPKLLEGEEQWSLVTQILLQVRVVNALWHWQNGTD